VVPNVFHLRMMEATVFLGPFNVAEMFWYPTSNQLNLPQVDSNQVVETSHWKRDAPELYSEPHSKGSEYLQK
jgi:hypothetical protein